MVSERIRKMQTLQQLSLRWAKLIYDAADAAPIFCNIGLNSAGCLCGCILGIFLYKSKISKLLLASQREGPAFISTIRLGFFCVEFACSQVWMWVGMVVYLYVLALRQPGNQSRVYPASRPKSPGIRSSPPTTLNRTSGREWMDGLINHFQYYHK